jgi:PAS domain S-box-containing protein
MNNNIEPTIEALKIEKQRLENEILVLRERLNLTLSVGNLAWWEMHLPTGMVVFNNNKIEMLGYTEEEFGSKVHYEKFMDLVHPDDYDKAMQAMRDHLTGTAEIYETEYRIRMKNGDYKWYYDRGSITEYDDDKQPLMIKGIVFDNSTRKKYEEALIKSESELRNANAAKDRFFSIIAHDLKSPFTSLIGLTELLHNHFHKYDNNKRLDLIKKILDTSDNTYQLLSDLLDWSRAEADNIQINLKELELNHLIDNVLTTVLPAAKRKNIDIKNQIKPETIILADENLTQTVFRNIISNAVKFTPENGRVLIGALEKHDIVEAFVNDNGVGIPFEAMDKLFQISYKYQTLGTNKESGTGLGLIVSHEFMEKNQGKIHVESQVNQGTTFYLTFNKPLH